MVVMVVAFVKVVALVVVRMVYCMSKVITIPCDGVGGDIGGCGGVLCDVSGHDTRS